MLLVHYDGVRVVGKATKKTEDTLWALLIDGEVTDSSFTLSMKLADREKPLEVLDYSASGKVRAKGMRLSGSLSDCEGKHWGSYEANMEKPWKPDFQIEEYEVCTCILLTWS